MYLKKLELSGFKSFAKTTILEFPSRITGIVGPNGAGKTNIKDAIQWVLGEQSMKSLRSKKGEDLIWNGSPASLSGRPQVPRMGKASITLLFDNKDGKIPLGFEEVALGRKIFRDGLNEYSLNNSQVRLKDVVELMARLGLGETKHNIIGQGEVDRLLLASGRERREMLEEALGLRVYQLKKDEAERKLDATDRNMRQAEALVREIAPHLKFLRRQAQRAEARESVGEELHGLERLYVRREAEDIAREEELLAVSRKPLADQQAFFRKEIERMAREAAALEEEWIKPPEVLAAERESVEAAKKRQELERHIGRLEGKLEAEREKLGRAAESAADLRPVAEEIRAALAEIRSLAEEEDRVEVLRSHLLVLVEDIERSLEGMVEFGEENLSTPQR